VAVVSETVIAVGPEGTGSQLPSDDDTVVGGEQLMLSTTKGDAETDTSPRLSPTEFGGEAGDTSGDDLKKRGSLRQRMRESLRKGPLNAS
jgi:hypothetical protein